MNEIRIALALGMAGAALGTFAAFNMAREAAAPRIAAAIVAPATARLYDLQSCIADKQAKGLPAFELCKGE